MKSGRETPRTSRAATPWRPRSAMGGAPPPACLAQVAAEPVVGAIFGVALFVLIASTLLPVEPPSGSDDTYVYVAVAFLAGFSERFAQDMFVRTGRAVLEPQRDPPMGAPTRP